MYHGKLVFAQTMEHWLVHEFHKCVSHYAGNYKSRVRCMLGIDLDATVYALDSTTIDLCLAVFPWAFLKPATGVLMNSCAVET